MKKNIVRLNEKSLIELENSFHKHFLIEDLGLIRVIMAAVVANRIAGDPLWLLLVGPPSGLKTEPLQALSKLSFIYPLSDLTENTFASGLKEKEEVSLLKKLANRTILTLKDFTTVLSMHRERRAAVLAQLREIYDGSFKKAWGTGKVLSWEGELGLIAGVTGVVDRYVSLYQTLGERFVQYRILQPDPVEVASRAIANQGTEQAVREELAQAVVCFYEGLNLTEIPNLSSGHEAKLANLASLCARARSGVIRDSYGNKEIEFVPDPEAPPRLAKQLALMTKALTLCGADNAYQLAQKIAFDSIQKTRCQVLTALVENGEDLESSELVRAVNLPRNTVVRKAKELEVLGLTAVSHSNVQVQWNLTELATRWLEASNSLEFLQAFPQVSGGKK